MTRKRKRPNRTSKQGKRCLRCLRCCDRHRPDQRRQRKGTGPPNSGSVSSPRFLPFLPPPPTVASSLTRFLSSGFRHRLVAAASAPTPMEVEETGRWDLLEWLGLDTSACIFRLLDDPADLVRAATVSRSWRHFVIHNQFCKSLCTRICPEVANFTRAVVVTRSPPPPPAARAFDSSQDAEDRTRETDHRIYSRLSGALVSTKPSTDCILQCIGASSTDYFPAESMENTLEPLERVNHRPSYWSSGGADDPNKPESLTYRLNSDLCMIDEIRIQPFEAYFQEGSPIYSAKALRIRLGHSKLPPASESFVNNDNENLTAIADENYVWTYTSPEFPMLQENVLQSFKLPRPVMCIGGVVRIELLGRVQKQDTDDRYYICVCHAQVMGRSLSPDFMIDVSDPAGYSALKYLPGIGDLCAEDVMAYDAADSWEWHSLVARYRQMRHLAMMDLLFVPPVHFMDEEDDAGDITDVDLPM